MGPNSQVHLIGQRPMPRRMGPPYSFLTATYALCLTHFTTAQGPTCMLLYPFLFLSLKNIYIYILKILSFPKNVISNISSI